VRRGLTALCALLLLGTAGCEDPRASAAPLESLPAGAWLVGDADALRSVLAGLSRLEGTRVARQAGRALERIVGCDEVLSHADGAAGLLDALACRPPTADVPAALAELRGEAALAWALPLPGRDPALLGLVDVVRGTADVDAAGGLRASLSLHPHSETGVVRLLVPGERTAGPPRLSGEATLIHARLRPADGLDLASAIAHGSQADRLFRLGSALFSGAALAGTWELAVYPPQPGDALPPMALGLDLEAPGAVRAGVDRFVADLEAAWPIRHREARFELGAGRVVSGACFFELRILPEFAPCWAIDADLLVVGWNGRALRHALSAPVASDDARPSLDGVVLALDRWPAAEVALGGEPAGYPWERVELVARGRGDEVRVALRAEPQP
jgi:hypothetical protein